MPNYVYIDLDMLQSRFSDLLLEVIAEGKCVDVVEDPIEVPDTIPTRKLKDYLWENSNQLKPGKAILMPEKSLTGHINRVTVGGEDFVYHSTWHTGREIWFGTKGIEGYGKKIIIVSTSDVLYVDETDEVDGYKPTFPSTGEFEELLKYWGRHNGDRPTWYGNKVLKAYPSSVRVIVEGFYDKTVNVSGKRPNNTDGYEDSKIIVKQSDVPGRGLALVVHRSCKSKVAYLEY